jgi:predicted HTH domain antitoxin
MNTMTTLMIPMPENISLALHLSNEALAEEIRMAAAVKLYELGRLSSGAASEMAGISKPLFLLKIADYTRQEQYWSLEELARDMKNA